MMPDAIRIIPVSIPSIQPKHALGTIKELCDFGDAEAPFEGLPNVGSHAVTPYAADFVRFVECGGRAVEEVACCFANVDEEGRFRVPHVVPELREREFAPDGKGDASEKAREGDDGTGAVVPFKRSGAFEKGGCKDGTYMGMQSYQRSPPGPGF